MGQLRAITLQLAAQCTLACPTHACYTTIMGQSWATASMPPDDRGHSISHVQHVPQPFQATIHQPQTRNHTGRMHCTATLCQHQRCGCLLCHVRVAIVDEAPQQLDPHRLVTRALRSSTNTGAVAAERCSQSVAHRALHTLRHRHRSVPAGGQRPAAIGCRTPTCAPSTAGQAAVTATASGHSRNQCCHKRPTHPEHHLQFSNK